MSYEVTYHIPWTLELSFGGVLFVGEAYVQVDVDVDRYGDVSKWNVTAIVTKGKRGFTETPDPTGYLKTLICDLQHDADGSFDKRVQREVDEDDHAPRPRSDAAEHGTLYAWGAP